MLKTFYSFKTDDVDINELRIAIFNVLFAENHDGEYFITLDDPRLESNLRHVGLTNLILINKTEVDNIYQETANKLIEMGYAVTKGDKTILSLTGKDIIDFKDAIKGKISVRPSEIIDFILLENGMPSDDFRFIVDCYKNGITHVIRKESDLALIKKQKVINDLLGRRTPATALIPEISLENKTTLDTLLKEGFKGTNIFNYLATIGRTRFQKTCSTKQEIEDTFSVDSLSKIIPEFDREHLKWMDTECK